MLYERFVVSYADRHLEGRTEADWLAMPVHGVQAVAAFPRLGPRRWTAVEDRDLWTGEEEYDPFGFGVKYGSKLSDEEYERVWREAFYGEH